MRTGGFGASVWRCVLVPDEPLEAVLSDFKSPIPSKDPKPISSKNNLFIPPKRIVPLLSLIPDADPSPQSAKIAFKRARSSTDRLSIRSMAEL